MYMCVAFDADYCTALIEHLVLFAVVNFMPQVCMYVHMYICVCVFHASGMYVSMHVHMYLSEKQLLIIWVCLLL